MSELHFKTPSNQILKSQGDHKNVSKHDHKSKQQNNGLNNKQIPNCAEENAENIPAHKSESGKVQTIRKCIRKGSRVCYTDMEKITVLRKIPEKDPSKSSVKDSQKSEEFEKIDSYRSGESLFKTFTFEQTRDIDDPETVKCIEFWKSVMKKNLAPIKCTLIESDRKSTEKQKDRTSVSSASKRSEDKKPDKKKNSIDFTGDGERIWSEALREIRKKKLDQLRLYTREKCQICSDPFTGDLKEEWGVPSIEETQAEIVSLNEWKPKEEQMDLIDASKPMSFRKRFSSKIKRVSTAQTIESRMNEKAASDQMNANNQSKTKNDIDSKHGYDRAELSKRPASILKAAPRTHRISSVSDLSRRNTAPQTSSVEVQAPNVKCPCDSDSCVCPHVAAARNSRTSFVEIVRKNMLHQDGSVEKFFPKAGEECVCSSFKPQPWLNLTCFNGPCPAKKAKIKVLESCSDFNLPRILENSEETCVCTKKIDVSCPSENCKNKVSQGSLIEGFPQLKTDEDFCVCTTNTEAPCISDVCPTKSPKEDKTCMCGKNLPWIQTTCQSWNCPHHRIIKRKIVEDEEKIKFRGHRPIRKLTNTCMCQDRIAWNKVECDRDFCVSRPRPSSILKVRDRKSSSLRNLKSSSRDLAKRKTSKTISNQSLERLSKEKEKSKPKFTNVDKTNGCICQNAPPWKLVTCQKCLTKNNEKNKANVHSISADRVSLAHDEECICKDTNIEPECKVYQCKNKEISLEYPPPCLCPKDVDESKHEHFRCISETCTMKKIDKTCICRSQPGAPCDAKTCVTKPRVSKTLVQTKKPLKYDAKCICKVRGLPTTQEVNCSAPQCPFQKKYGIKVTKPKTNPNLYVAPPREYKTPSAEEIAKACICGNNATSKSVTCHSVSCKRKNASFKSRQSNDSSMDENESNEELCICKDKQTDFAKEEQEIICNQIQCPKTVMGEDGTVKNDKCVCANLDQPCDEPTCPSAEKEIQEKICSDVAPKKDRPYCFICGHYDCAGTYKKLIDKKVCREVYTDVEEM